MIYQMNKNYTLFLNILKASLQQRPLNRMDSLSEKEYTAVIRLSQAHYVLPLIADVLCTNEKVLLRRRFLYREAKSRVIYQASRTAEFLLLYRKLSEVGLSPAVMKGLICRTLYPNPEQRASVDEDLLIHPEEIHKYHYFLLGHGFVPVEPDADIDHEFELAYENTETHLYLELHKTPFPSNSEAYGELSLLFNHALEKSIFVTVEDLSVRTLSPTDHLFYLFCHAYKHFLHGGFGIRQVCDIGLFTEKYMAEIDWEYITAQTGKLRLQEFVAAVYNILRKHLGLRCKGLPITLSGEGIQEEPLLLDILSGGLYGVNDENRTHSSTLTLNAAIAAKRGNNNGKLHFLRTVFPKKSSMEKRYPFLRKYPILLPVAWFIRIINYLKRETKEKQLNSKESIRIGEERVRLMKMYHMVE